MVRGWVRLRRRHRWLSHLIRAGHRYDQVDGRRLAAAVTYYGFFAVFALALFAFAVLGYVLDNPTVERSVQSYLAENMPSLDAQALREARGAVGIAAFVSVPIIGLLWVDALRSSIRAMWRINEYPGRLLFRWLIDLLALFGLGVLFAVSLGVAIVTTSLVGRLVGALGGVDFTHTHQLVAIVGYGLGLGINALLSIAVLTMLPRLRMPLRRALGPALLIAIGLEILKLLGRFVIERAEANPAFQVVAGAVGLLIFLLILNELILFAAALTATSTTGQVIDLATRTRIPACTDGGRRAATAPEPRTGSVNEHHRSEARAQGAGRPVRLARSVATRWLVTRR